MMNRKEWLRSSATLLAGGITALNGRLWTEEKSSAEIRKAMSSSREFISDEEYAQIAPMADLKAQLNANENPFGPSAKAREALIEAIETGNRYSFGPLRDLGQKIMEHENITQKQLMFAAGSSPILTACALHCVNQGGNIVTADPSYSDMPGQIEKFGMEVRWVSLTDKFKLNLTAMESEIDENTKLVYICNPNNPTATTVDTAELTAFCKRVSKKTTVFVDEAYIEYMDDPDTHSMMKLVSEGYNVIVARTFSKLYAFAGLRVGYMVAPEELIEEISPYTRGGFSISATSAAAASVAYRDVEFAAMVKSKTAESKEFLYATLKKEGYEYVPSDTNFLIFPIRMEGKRFMQEMWKRGVGIRHWNFNEQNWCRVTIGTMQDMEYFANAFHQIS